MEGKQGSGSRNLAHLCPYGCRVKNRSLVDRRVSARKPDASTLPRHRNAWLPSCWSSMRDQPPSPIRDVAAALLLLYRPKRLCQPRSDRGALIPRIIALDTLSVRERFGCFDHPSLSQPLQSWPVSLLLDKPRQSSTDLAADWRRSSLYRPAAQLRARTIGHGGHSYPHSQPTPTAGLSRTTLVVRAFRSRRHGIHLLEKGRLPTEGSRAMGDVGGAELSPTGSVSC